jgi:hypothetical protein
MQKEWHTATKRLKTFKISLSNIICLHTRADFSPHCLSMSIAGWGGERGYQLYAKATHGGRSWDISCFDRVELIVS